jgi:hypothetical protein
MVSMLIIEEEQKAVEEMNIILSALMRLDGRL